MAQYEAAGRTIGHLHGSSIGVGELHTIDVEMDRLYRRLEEFQMRRQRSI